MSERERQAAYLRYLGYTEDAKRLLAGGHQFDHTIESMLVDQARNDRNEFPGHWGRYHGSATQSAEGCKQCEAEARLYEDDPASHEDFESVPRWVKIGEVLHPECEGHELPRWGVTVFCKGTCQS